jgi:hypothetical protein
MVSEYLKRNRNIITIKTEDENYGIAIEKRDIKGDNDDYYVSKGKNHDAEAGNININTSSKNNLERNKAVCKDNNENSYHILQLTKDFNTQFLNGMTVSNKIPIKVNNYKGNSNYCEESNNLNEYNYSYDGQLLHHNKTFEDFHSDNDSRMQQSMFNVPKIKIKVNISINKRRQ